MNDVPSTVTVPDLVTIRAANSRRGLTLLELLMSLTILSGLVAVTIPWLNTTAQFHTNITPRQTWQLSAERFVQLLREDLALGDFALGDEDRLSKTESDDPVRVLIDDSAGALQIRTRLRPGVDSVERRKFPIGPIIRVYRFDEQTHSIRLQLHQVDLQDHQGVGRLIGEGGEGEGEGGGGRLVLDNITAWECRIEPLVIEGPESTDAADSELTAILHLRITSKQGDTIRKSLIIKSS